jgi:N,N'-diacetylchitobiose transport system substrate-binding protein
MKRILAAAALATAGALMLSACGSETPTNTTTAETTAPADNTATAETTSGQDITLWLAGGDTPDALREYLKTTYNANTGGTLTIEEQSWGDLVAKLTTALPDSANTPDVVEVGNTQSPTFTNVGAFADISDMYTELGGDKLLQ